MSEILLFYHSYDNNKSYYYKITDKHRQLNVILYKFNHDIYFLNDICKK